MRLRHVVAASTVLLALVATPVVAATSSAPTNLTCATQVVSTWSTSRLANETIVVSVNAANIGAMGPAARAGYGGLILFGLRAPAKFTGTLATLQKETPGRYAMMIETDQEGGGVERLTNLVATLPWAQTMGKNLNAAAITAEGLRVGRSMVKAGINTDLAPVLDVDGRAQLPGATNPDGFRSFSGVPTTAAIDGSAFMNGLAEAGVTSVVKHFPGLGGSTGNTDYGAGATLPWSTLQTGGLVPFETAIADGATAVMMSNATVPGLTSMPASVSSVVYQYLRQELGFSGLIVTDSLGAGALSAVHLGVPAAAVRALEAGADQLLLSSPTTPAASLHLALLTSNAIQRAVASGALPLATLQLAAAHVLAMENHLTCAPPAS